MHFAQLLQLLLGLAPSIINAVQAAEKAVPGKGQGSKKLNMVLSTVSAAAAAAPLLQDSAHDVRDGLRDVRGGNITPEAIAQINNGVTAFIGATVSIFNAAGAFQNQGEQSAGE